MRLVEAERSLRLRLREDEPVGIGVDAAVTACAFGRVRVRVAPLETEEARSDAEAADAAESTAHAAAHFRFRFIDDNLFLILNLKLDDNGLDTDLPVLPLYCEVLNGKKKCDTNESSANTQQRKPKQVQISINSSKCKSFSYNKPINQNNISFCIRSSSS